MHLEWRYSFMYSQSEHYIRSMAKFTPQPVHPRGKSTMYRLSRRLGGPRADQDVCLCWESKDSLLVQPVAWQLPCFLRHPPSPKQMWCGSQHTLFKKHMLLLLLFFSEWSLVYLCFKLGLKCHSTTAYSNRNDSKVQAVDASASIVICSYYSNGAIRS